MNKKYYHSVSKIYDYDIEVLGYKKSSEENINFLQDTLGHLFGENKKKQMFSAYIHSYLKIDRNNFTSIKRGMIGHNIAVCIFSNINSNHYINSYDYNLPYTIWFSECI
jgi:hypothetical protein